MNRTRTIPRSLRRPPSPTIRTRVWSLNPKTVPRAISSSKNFTKCSTTPRPSRTSSSEKASRSQTSNSSPRNSRKSNHRRRGPARDQGQAGRADSVKPSPNLPGLIARPSFEQERDGSGKVPQETFRIIRGLRQRPPAELFRSMKRQTADREVLTPKNTTKASPKTGK